MWQEGKTDLATQMQGAPNIRARNASVRPNASARRPKASARPKCFRLPPRSASVRRHDRRALAKWPHGPEPSHHCHSYGRKPIAVELTVSLVAAAFTACMLLFTPGRAVCREAKLKFEWYCS